MFRRLGSVMLAVACLTLFGCGKSAPKPCPISGTVTLDGKPLSEGIIYFKTVATGAIDSADVKDGKFQGQAEPGDRRVEINSYRVTTTDMNGMKSEVKTNTIPPRYNTESTLTAKITPEGPNQFTFDLSSKK